MSAPPDPQQPINGSVTVQQADNLLTVADTATVTVIDAATVTAIDAETESAALIESDVTVGDFYAYMPTHQYIFTPTREMWTPTSVNARAVPPINEDGTRTTKQVARKAKDGTVQFDQVPISATEWIDRHRPVEQMTWAPGAPLIIADRLIDGGGWIEREGVSCFNLYRPPKVIPADVRRGVAPWLDHVHRVFPDSAEHIVRWLAHRVQRPGEKINHALVLGGAQGIGKDTMLEPVKYAVGPWNFTEVTPLQLLGRFNGFVKSVILRVSEARDLGEFDRFGFYDHMKAYTAAPPGVLRCDEKNLREHAVLNVCGVIITTNHKADGIYLPDDDRRHYVVWSDLTKENFTEEYWNALWGWYLNDDGIGRVAAFLQLLDLSGFNAKAPPPKTAAFYDIVNANRSGEDAELADLIDLLKKPKAMTITDLLSQCVDENFRDWLTDRKNRRQIPHRLEGAGYVPVRNDADSHDGHWKVNGRRQVIYARRDLSLRDRLTAARQRCAMMQVE